MLEQSTTLTAGIIIISEPDIDTTKELSGNALR
jgi:hypothetical protein